MTRMFQATVNQVKRTRPVLGELGEASVMAASLRHATCDLAVSLVSYSNELEGDNDKLPERSKANAETERGRSMRLTCDGMRTV